jgi:hypothetical protein
VNMNSIDKAVEDVQGQVPQVMRDLIVAYENLSRTVEILEEKLAPVLIPRQEETNTKMEQKNASIMPIESQIVPLAKDLNIVVANINRCVQACGSMIERTQL